jgi:L-fuculose-phosphate aldolase
MPERNYRDADLVLGLYDRDKDEVIDAGKRILEAGLVAGTWGNISKRAGKGVIAITPSGMDYLTLKREDIVLVDPDGERLESRRKPSSELETHLAIYRARADVNAVVHTHSVFASALACARKKIPPIVEDLAQIIGGAVEINEYRLPGTKELAQSVVKALGDRNACLLVNHGVLTTGRTMTEALYAAEVVEKTAKIFIAAGAVGGAVELSREDVKTMRDNYLSSYGQR